MTTMPPKEGDKTQLISYDIIDDKRPGCPLEKKIINASGSDFIIEGKGYPGMSGSPVLIDCKIVGIVKQIRKDGDQIVVTPLKHVPNIIKIISLEDKPPKIEIPERTVIMGSPSPPRQNNPKIPCSHSDIVIRIEMHPNRNGRGNNFKMASFEEERQLKNCKPLECNLDKIWEDWNAENDFIRRRKSFNDKIKKFQLELLNFIKNIQEKKGCNYRNILLEFVLPTVFLGVPFEQILNDEQKQPLGTYHKIYIVPQTDRNAPEKIKKTIKKEICPPPQGGQGQWIKNYPDFLIFLIHQCCINDLCEYHINILSNQAIPFVCHRLPISYNKEILKCNECPTLEEYNKLIQNSNQQSNHLLCPEISRFFEKYSNFENIAYEEIINQVLEDLLKLRSSNINCPEIQDLFIVCKNSCKRKIKIIPRQMNPNEV